MKRHQPFAYCGIGWFQTRDLFHAKGLLFAAATANICALISSARVLLDVRYGDGRLKMSMAAFAGHVASADILSAISRQKRHAWGKALTVIADVPAGGIS